MNEEDKPRFAKAMKIIGMVFQEVPDDDQKEIYFRLLGDITIEDFEAVAMRLMKERRSKDVFGFRFPLPGDLRDMLPPVNTAEFMCPEHKVWHKCRDVQRRGCYNKMLVNNRIKEEKRRAIQRKGDIELGQKLLEDLNIKEPK